VGAADTGSVELLLAARIRGIGTAWTSLRLDCETEAVKFRAEKLIIAGQQMGNTTVKTSRRCSTMTHDETL